MNNLAHNICIVMGHIFMEKSHKWDSAVKINPHVVLLEIAKASSIRVMPFSIVTSHVWEHPYWECVVKFKFCHLGKKCCLRIVLIYLPFIESGWTTFHTFKDNLYIFVKYNNILCVVYVFCPFSLLGLVFFSSQFLRVACIKRVSVLYLWHTMQTIICNLPFFFLLHLQVNFFLGRLFM